MSSVDVIVPCYGYGRFLRACVDSVVAQRGVDVRVLVVDDCSPDETSEVAAGLAARHAGVSWIRHPRNRGHIASYNEGLDWSRADYVLVLSADDALTPGSLARAVSVLDRHPTAVLAYGRDVVFEDDALPSAVASPPACEYELVDYAHFLRASCALGHTPMQAPAVLVRASAHRRAGYYLGELPHTADTELWLRLAARGEVAVLDAAQAYRRLHAANMSLSFTSAQRLREQMHAFDRHFASHPRFARECRRLLARGMAERALWSAMRALESGHAALARDFVALARECRPSVRWTPLWSKVWLKGLLRRGGLPHTLPRRAVP